MQTYILLCYITYSNVDCCYDSSNYIKDLDLEVCVCVCVCECLPGLCVHVCMWYKNSLTKPDPYAGGEGLVTCYTRSCSGALYRAAPIRLQLHYVTIVTRLYNITHYH